MLKPTHVTTTYSLSLTGLLLSHQIVNLTFSIPFLLGNYLGSFLPDIDNPHAKINRHHPIIGHYLAKHHRGITHSLLALLFWAIITFLAYSIANNIITLILANYCLGLSFGYLIHLIEDDFSVQGVLWCYPFTHFKTGRNQFAHYKARQFHRWFYYTGSRTETWIRRLNYPILGGLIYLSLIQII